MEINLREGFDYTWSIGLSDTRQHEYTLIGMSRDKAVTTKARFSPEEFLLLRDLAVSAFRMNPPITIQAI